MPFEIRHETPEYLQALGTAAERLGQRKRKEEDWRQKMEEERLQLQREAQAAAEKRYTTGLDFQRETREAAYKHAEDMARLNAEMQIKRLGQEYALRQKYGALPGEAYRYTPAQVRDFEKKQAAIQQIMQSKALRPEQKVQAVNQIIRGMRNILPMPSLPKTGETQIQEAMKDRVFLNPDGTYWVLNGENIKLETPSWMVTPDAYAKIYQTVTEMLTKKDEEEREIKPTAAEVERFIAEQFFKSYQTYMQLMRQGGPKPMNPSPTQAPRNPPDSRLQAMFPTQMGRGENLIGQILPPEPAFMPSVLQGGGPVTPTPAPMPTPTPTPQAAPWTYAGFGVTNAATPSSEGVITPWVNEWINNLYQGGKNAYAVYDWLRDSGVLTRSTPTPTPQEGVPIRLTDNVSGGVPTNIRLMDDMSGGIPTDIRLMDNVSAGVPSTLQPTPTPTLTPTPTPTPKYPPQVSEKLAPYYRPETGLLMLPDGSVYVLDSNGKWLQVREGKKQR